MARNAIDSRSHLIFIDEAGFMLTPAVGKTWAPRGHTPIMKVSASSHERISAIGAMTIRVEPRLFGFRFHLLPDNANFHGSSVAAFVEYLHWRLGGRITILWDSIPIHSAKPVADYVARNHAIKAEPLPLYAPELNPVEHVWTYVKYGRMSNYCPYNLVELRGRVKAELFRVQKAPKLLEALFRHSGLDLDA